MTGLSFLDANILLYSISSDRAEVAKRERAISLLQRDDIGLSVQVLGEFYVQATRPTRRDALTHEIAAGLIEAWLRFPVQDLNREIVLDALSIRATHGFSYWDSAIIAAASALGCRQLYTEDLTHGQDVHGMRIIDPFR
jgi:predicted nucleic acid-binding protein